MFLHVTFSDGSNPWISLPADRQTIAKLWRRWMKYHASTARPVAICGNYEARKSAWHAGYYITSRTGYGIPRQYYMRLGNALAAMERAQKTEQ